MQPITARNQPTYHRGNCKSQREPVIYGAKDLEKRRAAWRALPKKSRLHGPKRGPGRANRLIVFQSQISGTSCCDYSSKCEWLCRGKRGAKCEWYGDALKCIDKYSVNRVNDCLTERVPSKTDEGVDV